MFLQKQKLGTVVMLQFTAYSSLMGGMRACSVQGEWVVGSEAGFLKSHGAAQASAAGNLSSSFHI